MEGGWIAPDAVPREAGKDLGRGVHVDGREVVCFLTLYLRDIAPVGVGLAMEGAERPPPLSLVCHCDTVLTSGNTPAARPLPRPPPAPSRGGGQCVAIVRMVVHGEETGLSGNFLA